MTTKTIKISEENYEWLIRYSGDLQKEVGKPISVDKAFSAIRKDTQGKDTLLEFAGSWKMTDEEERKIFKTLKEGWKRWKTFV